MGITKHTMWSVQIRGKELARVYTALPEEALLLYLQFALENDVVLEVDIDGDWAYDVIAVPAVPPTPPSHPDSDYVRFQEWAEKGRVLQWEKLLS